MNIFILDNDLTKSAQYHADKHVVKMILESVQILSSVVRKTGIDAGYKETHKNHPCVLWAGKSLDNWLYLRNLVEELHKEWKFRYKHPNSKEHKSYTIMKELPVPELPNIGLTPFAQAMPDQYKNDDAVKAYRDYYNGEKRHLFNWKNREKPYWIKE